MGAALNVAFKPSGTTEVKVKPNALTAVPNGAGGDIADKATAIEETKSLYSLQNNDTASLATPIMKEVVQDNSITQANQMEHINTIANQYALPPPYTPPVAKNRAANENVPRVIYVDKDEDKPVKIVSKTEGKKVEVDEEVKVDPYAANTSLTLGTPGSSGKLKTVYNGTFLTEKTVTDGDVVNIRNTESINYNSLSIPKNTLLKGLVSISSNKMYILIALNEYKGGEGLNMDVSQNGTSKGLRIYTEDPKGSAGEIINEVGNASSQVIPSSGVVGKIRSVLNSGNSTRGNRNTSNSFFIPGGLKLKLIIHNDE